MTLQEFIARERVPGPLQEKALTLLRDADFQDVAPQLEPVARRIIASLVQGHVQRTASTHAALGIRTAAAEKTKLCERCGSPMRKLSVAGGLPAYFCEVDKVTDPVEG